jgi:hypothetical protein
MEKFANMFKIAIMIGDIFILIVGIDFKLHVSTFYVFCQFSEALPLSIYYCLMFYSILRRNTGWE